MNYIVGSFAYGLPREAVQFRTWELEGLRKRVHLLNLLWSHSLKNPNILCEKKVRSENEKEISKKEEPNFLWERNEGRPINLNIDKLVNGDEKNHKKETKTLFDIKSEKEKNVDASEKENILDEKEMRRMKTLEAMEKRLSLKE